MKVLLQTVEFWREVRGPGTRNQSEVVATFSTQKVRSGEKEPSASGYCITWDQDARAIMIEKVGVVQDPVVIYPWNDVRRAIPLDAQLFIPERLAPHTQEKSNAPQAQAQAKAR